MRTLIGLSACLLVGAACRPPEDSERATLRARLAAPARLSDDEVTRLVSWAVAAASGKVIRVREGGGTRTLDSKARTEVLALLAGDVPVADSGIRQDGAVTMRGISGPGTPPQAELDAAQTLWIDIATFLPRRFELVYSLPGMGDVVYELEIGP